ncbi:hypothetical protein M514_09692 [Trichuris suis]|uniref:Peptidase S1 domain-containing protein n=1 Tax=Trichuris suis TaxID=68888 RepID=A0A085N2E5_9BILA|nr:hypothetical protein M513_09692 [Trichuris suis]KFD63641.1 hypothetical protein M514_09692 [Trichuris suis]
MVNIRHKKYGFWAALLIAFIGLTIFTSTAKGEEKSGGEEVKSEQPKPEPQAEPDAGPEAEPEGEAEDDKEEEVAEQSDSPVAVGKAGDRTQPVVSKELTDHLKRQGGVITQFYPVVPAPDDDLSKTYYYPEAKSAGGCGYLVHHVLLQPLLPRVLQEQHQRADVDREAADVDKGNADVDKGLADVDKGPADVDKRPADAANAADVANDAVADSGVNKLNRRLRRQFSLPYKPFATFAPQMNNLLRATAISLTFLLSALVGKLKCSKANETVNLKSYLVYLVDDDSALLDNVICLGTLITTNVTGTSDAVLTTSQCATKIIQGTMKVVLAKEYDNNAAVAMNNSKTINATLFQNDVGRNQHGLAILRLGSPFQLTADVRGINIASGTTSSKAQNCFSVRLKEGNLETKSLNLLNATECRKELEHSLAGESFSQSNQMCAKWTDTDKETTLYEGPTGKTEGAPLVCLGKQLIQYGALLWSAKDVTVLISVDSMETFGTSTEVFIGTEAAASFVTWATQTSLNGLKGKSIFTRPQR